MSIYFKLALFISNDSIDCITCYQTKVSNLHEMFERMDYELTKVHDIYSKVFYGISCLTLDVTTTSVSSACFH